MSRAEVLKQCGSSTVNQCMNAQESSQQGSHRTNSESDMTHNVQCKNAFAAFCNPVTARDKSKTEPFSTKPQ